MKVDHRPAPRRLIESVHVLREQHLALSSGLQPSQGAMRVVRTSLVEPAPADHAARQYRRRSSRRESFSAIWPLAPAVPHNGSLGSTGFADRESMRRAFLRSFGQPPQAIRRAAEWAPV